MVSFQQMFDEGIPGGQSKLFNDTTIHTRIEQVDPQSEAQVRVRGVLVPSPYHVGTVQAPPTFTGQRIADSQVARREPGTSPGGLHVGQLGDVVSPRQRPAILNLKPHLFKMWTGYWKCRDSLGKVGVGQTPQDAYRRWERAASRG